MGLLQSSLMTSYVIVFALSVPSCARELFMQTYLDQTTQGHKNKMQILLDFLLFIISKISNQNTWGEIKLGSINNKYRVWCHINTCAHTLEERKCSALCDLCAMSLCVLLWSGPHWYTLFTVWNADPILYRAHTQPHTHDHTLAHGDMSCL